MDFQKYNFSRFPNASLFVNHVDLVFYAHLGIPFMTRLEPSQFFIQYKTYPENLKGVILNSHISNLKFTDRDTMGETKDRLEAQMSKVRSENKEFHFEIFDDEEMTENRQFFKSKADLQTFIGRPIEKFQNKNDLFSLFEIFSKKQNKFLFVRQIQKKNETEDSED
jgi:hypothetical protein